MIYVDRLMDRGWVLRGERVMSCHLFADGDRAELASFAAGIGLPSTYMHTSRGRLHYDLTEGMRARALAAGAVEVTNKTAAKMWAVK
jgi:hypothetical protein